MAADHFSRIEVLNSNLEERVEGRDVDVDNAFLDGSLSDLVQACRYASKKDSVQELAYSRNGTRHHAEGRAPIESVEAKGRSSDR